MLNYEGRVGPRPHDPRVPRRSCLRAPQEVSRTALCNRTAFALGDPPNPQCAVSSPMTVMAGSGQVGRYRHRSDEPVPVAQRSWYRKHWPNRTRAGPFACIRAASRPSTAGPPTCTKYSGRPQHQTKTCTSCGAPARTNGAAARRSSSTPSLRSAVSRSPWTAPPPSTSCGSSPPATSSGGLCAPGDGTTPSSRAAQRHAVRTAPAASRTAVRVVARRLRDWPTGQMLPVAALGGRLLRERDAEWPRRRVSGAPAISVAFSSGLIQAGGRGPSRSRRSHPTGRERCRRAAARRCRSGSHTGRWWRSSACRSAAG